MKRYSFIVAYLLLPFLCRSQSFIPYRVLDIGFGAALNTAIGDAETFKRTKSLHVSFGYNLDSYTSLVGEIQAGKLAGGDSLTTFSGRQFSNQFSSFCFRGQLKAGKVSDNLPATIQKFYLSSGIGFISSTITNINRNSLLIVGYSTPTGRNTSVDFFVPVRLGFEYPIKNAYRETILKIDLAYQHNFVLGDDLDGFSAGKSKDIFSQISLGFKAGILGRRW